MLKEGFAVQRTLNLALFVPSFLKLRPLKLKAVLVYMTCIKQEINNILL